MMCGDAGETVAKAGHAPWRSRACPPSSRRLSTPPFDAPGVLSASRTPRARAALTPRAAETSARFVHRRRCVVALGGRMIEYNTSNQHHRALHELSASRLRFRPPPRSLPRAFRATTEAKCTRNTRTITHFRRPRDGRAARDVMDIISRFAALRRPLHRLWRLAAFLPSRNRRITSESPRRSPSPPSVPPPWCRTGPCRRPRCAAAGWI